MLRRLTQFGLLLALPLALPSALVSAEAASEPASTANSLSLREQVHQTLISLPVLSSLARTEAQTYEKILDNVVNLSKKDAPVDETQIMQAITPIINDAFKARLIRSSDALVISYYRLQLKQATRTQELDNCFAAGPTPNDAALQQKLVLAVFSNPLGNYPAKKADRFDAELLRMMGNKSFAQLYAKLLSKQPINCREQFWVYAAALALPTKEAAATLRSFHPGQPADQAD